MASLTPFAVGSPFAVSAPLIGSSVPILIVLPPAAPDEPGAWEQAANTNAAITPSTPILASFIYGSSSSRVRLVTDDPGRLPGHPGFRPFHSAADARPARSAFNRAVGRLDRSGMRDSTVRDSDGNEG